MDLTVIAYQITNASPHVTYDLITRNPCLLEGDIDEQIELLLIRARRRGDGLKAGHLGALRRLLQRFREYGPERVLARDVLDSLVSLQRDDLQRALGGAPVTTLLNELRLRLDAALEIGDMVSWQKWLRVKLEIEHPEAKNTWALASPLKEDPEAEWAQKFFHERNLDLQCQMLQNTTRPLPFLLLQQVLAHYQALKLIAINDRDALQVIHLRKAFGLFGALTAEGIDANLIADVLAGRAVPFAIGMTP